MRQCKPWYQSIKWRKICFACQSENNGICPDRECAEAYYGLGDKENPSDIIQFDGDYQLWENHLYEEAILCLEEIN